MSSGSRSAGGLFLLVMAVAGCSRPVASDAPGTATIEMPGYQAPAPGTPAPPGLEGGAVSAASAASAAPAPRNGPYAGRGHALNDPGGRCSDNFPITNFIVRGNQVSFGAYSGTIQPNGELRMQGGPTTVTGRFVGAHFEGRFWAPGAACLFTMSLDPVG